MRIPRVSLSQFGKNRRLQVVAVLLVSLLIAGVALVFHPFTAHGNACVSNGTGGGNWNAAGTWTGCAGGTPGGADSVTITAGDTVTVNTTASIASLTFGSGATAAVLQDDGNGESITISGAVDMGQPTASATNNWNLGIGVATVGGTVTFSGSSSTAGQVSQISITNGQLNANGGITFTASASANAVLTVTGIAGSVNLKGALTVPANSSTFTMSAGTFTYADTSAQTINFPSAGSYNNLTLANSGGATLSAAVTTGNVAGNLSTTSGTFKNGGFAIAGNTGKTFGVSNGAAFEMSGTSTYPTGFSSFTYGPSSTVRYLQTSTPLTITTASYGNLDLKPAGTATQNIGSSLTVSGNLTVGDGTNTTTVSAASGLVTLNVLGNMTIAASGTFVANAATMNVTGSWSNSGTFTNSSGTVNFNSTSGVTQTIAGTLTGSSAFNNITFNGVGGVWSFSASADVNSSFLITNGAVTAPSGTLTLKGTYTNSGTFTHNSGTVVFAATSLKNWSGTMTGSSSFYNLTVSGTSGTLQLGANIAVANNVSLTDGTFDSSATNYSVTVTGNFTTTGTTWAINMRAATWTVSGNWDSSSANNITPGSSTLVMDGSGTKTLKTGGSGSGSIFYNVQVGAAGGKTTQFLSNIAYKGVLTLGAGTLDINSNVLYTYCGGSNTNPLSLNASGTFGSGLNGQFIFSSALGSCNMNLPGFTYNVLVMADQMASGTITMQGTTTITGMVSLGCCTPSSAISGVIWDTNGQTISVGAIAVNNGAPQFLARTSALTITSSIFGSTLNMVCSGCTAGNGVFTAATSTVTFTNTSGTVDTAGNSLYNATFNKSGGSWSPGSALTVTHDLTLTLGTFTNANTTSVTNNMTVAGGTFTNNSALTVGADLLSSGGTLGGTGDVTVNGNVACSGTCGTITLTGGTFEQRVGASKNFGTSVSGSTVWTFNNLTFSNSTASPLTVTTSTVATGGITVSGNLLVGKNLDTGVTSLDAGNRIWTLNGTGGTPFQLLASPAAVLIGNTSTISYNGNAAGNTTVQSSSGYYNLSANNTAESYDLGGNITVANNLNIRGVIGGATLSTTGSNYSITAGNITIGNGSTLNANASTITLTGTSSTLFSQATGTFTQGTSTVIVASASGSPSLLSVATTFHILIINAPSATVINAGANITTDNVAGNKFYVQAGVFNLEGRTITPGTSGTLQVDSGATFCLGGTTGSTTASCDSGATQTSASTFPAFSSINLNAASTVTYLADAAQTISTSPGSYGNLNLTPKMTASRAYTMGGALTIHGNLNVKPKASSGSLALTVSLGGATAIDSTASTTIQPDTTNTPTASLATTASNYNLSTGNLDIEANGTLDASSSTSTISVSLNYTNNGTFTAGSSTMSFTSTAPSKTLTGTLSGSSAFYNLTFSGSGGDWTPASTVLVTNDLTMSAGSLLGTQNITVNGNVVGTAGIINLTGGTFEQRPNNSSENFGASSGSSAWNFNNLRFSNSAPTICVSPDPTITTQAGGSGAINVAGTLTIAKSGDICGIKLNAGSRTWSLTGTTTTPFVITSSPTGTFIPNTSTFAYTGGTGVSGDINTAATTYYNLTIGPSCSSSCISQNYLLSGSTSASNNLTVNSTGATFDVTASNYALNVGGTWSNTGVFNARNGTVTFNGTNSGKNIGGNLTGGSAFYNVTIDGVGGTWTTINDMAVGNNFVINHGSYDTNCVSSHNVTITGNLTAGSGTWALGMCASTWTVNGNWDTSAVATDSSSINYGTSTLIMSGSGTKTIKTGSTNTYIPRFYNLQVGASAGKTTQLLSDTSFANLLTLGAGTLDLNSNGLYAAGIVNPLSLNPSGTFGTGNGSYITYGGVNTNLPAFTYHSSVVVQQNTSNKMVQQGTTTITGGLYIGCCSRASEYDTGNQTLTVGGTITWDNSTTILTAGSSTITVGGNWANSAGGVFNKGTSTIVFNSGSGATITSGGRSFNNLTIGGTGNFTPQDAMTVTGSLTMTSGTLNGTQNITVNGDVAGTAGVISLTGGTFEQRVAANQSFGTTSGATGWAFNNLTFSNSTGSGLAISSGAGSGTVTVSGNLLIGKNLDTGATSFDAGARSWTLNSSGGTSPNPFQILASPAGVFTPSTSTFTFSNTPASGNITVQNTTYNKLIFNSTGKTFVLAGNTTTNGRLTITAGTLDVTASNYSLTVGGNFSNSGTFTARNGTVTLNGSAQQTVSGTNTGTSAFYNLTITNNSGASATDNELTGFTPSVIFSSVTGLTATGTFTITTANVRVQYQNTATYTFNTVNWNGQSKLTRIFFRNSDATIGHTWLLNVTTQTAVSYINVSRSDATTSAGPILANDTTSYDAGSNTNWTFGASITVSGNIYIQGSEVTTNTTPVNVSISVNNGAPSTQIGDTGSYSMSSTYDGAGSVIMVYIDGNALDANTVTIGNGSTISGLNLYINRTAIYNSNSGNTTNANVCSQSTYPASGDNLFTCSSGVPTYTGDYLIVNGGYAPGGNVNAPVMEINTGGTYTGASETLALTGSGTGTSRPLYINGGTFTPTSDTVTFTGTSNSDIEATTYNNLQLYPVSGTQTYKLNTGTLTTNGNLDVGNGSTLTIDAATNNTTVTLLGNLTLNTSTVWNSAANTLSIGGNYTNSGTFTANSGTVKFTAAGTTKTLTGTMTSGSAFYNLTFDGVLGAWNFSNDVAVGQDFTVNNGIPTANNHNLTVTRDFTLTSAVGVGYVPGSSTITVSRNFSDAGTKITPGTSTVVLNGTGTVTTGSSSTDFFNVSVAYSTKTTTLSSGSYLRLTGTLTFNGGTLNQAASGARIYIDVTATGSPIVFASPTTITNIDWNVNLQTNGITLTLPAADYGSGTQFNLAYRKSSGSTSATVQFGGNITMTNTMGMGTQNSTNSLTVNTGNFSLTTAGLAFGQCLGFTCTNPVNMVLGSSTVTLGSGGLIVGSNAGSHTLDMGSSSVSTTGPVTFANGTGAITVTPGTSTLTWVHTSGTKIYTPNGQSLYNLTLNGLGGTVQPAGAVVVTNNFTITAGTYDTVSGSNYALTIGGSYSNSGTFTAQNGTVTFNATAPGKTLSGTLNSTSAFYNLTFSGSGGAWTMGSASTVNNNLAITNGTLNDGGNQITGNVTGTLTAAAGTTLTLGASGAATTFPATFTSGHTTLDVASTVIYQAYVPQTISGTPTYGNLRLSAASGTPIKPLGGATVVAGNLTIDAANTLDTSSGNNYALSIGGNYTNNGTFTAQNGTVTFTSTASGNTLSGTLNGSSSFYNLVFGVSGSPDWTPGSALAVTNDLTMTAGSLLGTQNVTVNGNVAGTAGIINLTGGTFEQRVGVANKNFGTTSGAAAWAFYNLTFSNSNLSSSRTITTQAGTGGLTVTNQMRVGGLADDLSTALDVGSRTWTLAGTTGTPLILTPTLGLLTINTSTFVYTGNNVGGNTTISMTTGVACAYYKLVLNNASETYQLPMACSTSSDLTITAGTLDVTTSNYALNIGGNYSNSGTFTARNGTVTFGATAPGETLSGTLNGTSAFYNLTFNGVSGTWTFNNPVTVGNDFNVTNGSVTAGSNALTVGRDYILTSAAGVAYHAGTSTITVTRHFTDSGNKFDYGTTSSVVMVGSGTLTTGVGDSINNLSIGPSGFTTTLAVSNPLYLYGALTFNGGTVSGNSNAISSFASTPYVFASPTTLTGGQRLNVYATSGPKTIAAGNYGNWNLEFTVENNPNIAINLAGDITTTGTVTTYALYGATNASFNTQNHNITAGGYNLGYQFGSSTTPIANNFGSSTVTINGDFTEVLNGGPETIDFGTSNVSVSGNVTFVNGTGSVTVTPGTSTFTMAPPNATTKTIASNGQSFYNFTVNGSGGIAQLASALTTTNNLTITAGTLDTKSGSNYALTVGGNFANSGTFTANSGTVTLNGTAQQTVSGTNTGTSAFFNLTITNNSGASATDNELTGFTPSVIFSSTTGLTATGTFTITTANVRVQYQNGKTYTFNTVNWNGQSKLTRIFFRNSDATTGHTWLLNVTNQTAVSSVNVSRSDATTSAGPILANDTTSYDAGSNINWTFGATITVSGNIYIQGSEVTTNSTPVNVSISVNNGAPSTITGQTSSYSMANVYDGVGTVITVYIDGNALNANTFTIGGGATISGLNLYINRTAIYNSNSGNTTNANICGQSTYPTAGDATFTCTSSVPTYSGDSLLIFGGYAPGGNVNAPVMEINTGGTYTGGTETLTLSGSGTGTSRPLYINGGTFTPTSDTVTFTGTSSSDIQSTTYYNLQLYPVSGTQTYTLPAGTFTVGNNLDVGNGSTLTVAANTNNPTVTVTGNMTINTGTTWTNSTGSLAINGSYANSGTYTAGTGTVTFGSTASGKTLSGNMTGSSALYKLAFNGTGGAWTIQDPLTVTADATDTLNVIAGTVTLGNGSGDNLEVRGALEVAATANQTAVFQTAAIAVPGTITIDINQNNSGTPPACTNCSITVGASSGSGQGSFKLAKNTILRLNPNSVSQVDLPVTVNSTGYFEALGSQDYTGTSTSGTGEGTLVDSGKTWTAGENNTKLLRLTSGLALGQMYSITATSTTTLSYASTESSTANMTVTGTGTTRLICSNSTTLITSDHQGAGRYVHDKTGSTGYLQIIDSKNNDTNCSGSKDSFSVMGNPDSLSILANNDTFTLSDGVRSGDTYEILDPATVTAEAGTACTATVNETGKGEAYIYAQSSSQTLIRYANICNLGRNSSNEYGISFNGINGGNAQEGFTVENSWIRNNYRGISGRGGFASLTSDSVINNSISGGTTGISIPWLSATNVNTNRITDTTTSGISISYTGFTTEAGSISNNIINNPGSIGLDYNIGVFSTATLTGNSVFGAATTGINISGIQIIFSGSTIVGNGSTGFLLGNGTAEVTVSGNTLVGLGTGISGSSSARSTISGNNISDFSAYGIHLTTSSGNSISGNTIAGLPSTSNKGISLETTSKGNLVFGNTISSTQRGIELTASNNNTFTGNTVGGNTAGFATNTASTGITLINEAYGASQNSSADIDLNGTASQLSLYKTSLSSPTQVTGDSNASTWIISRQPKNVGGVTKIWGNYSTPAEVSETPQTEATDTFNYANNLWEKSVTAHSYSGNGTEDSNLDYDLSSANLSGGPYVYSVVAATNSLACASTTFTVYRNGSNVGTATCGTQFTDSNAAVNVKFKIDGGTPTTYGPGDTYTFTAWDAANDTSTAKSVQLMTTAGSYTVPSGSTLAAIGTAANPTEFTRGFPAGGWHMNVAGTINAQYYNMYYLGGTGGASGLNLQAGATVTNIANGNFDNYQTTGGGSDTFITIDGSLIGTGTPAKTFDSLVFTQGLSAPNYTVKESGGSPVTGNYWLLSTATCNGWSTCELSDSDTGDGAGSPNQDGFIRFVPTVIANPTVNTRIPNGSVRVNGGTIQVP